jgi:hypothetical protein
VEGSVQQHVVQVEADAAEVGAAQLEARVEIVVGTDAGQAFWTARSGSSARAEAGFLASLPPGTTCWGCPYARFRKAGLHFHGIGAAEGLGAEDHLEIPGLAGVQVKGLLDQVVANGGDVESVIAGSNAGDTEAACGIRGNAKRAKPGQRPTNSP